MTRFVLSAWALALFAGAVFGKEEPAQLAAALRQGGYVIYLRHARTDRTRDDAAHPDLADCTTQRGLSLEGQEQADDLGFALLRLSIPVGDVFSSPFCRAMETARRAFPDRRPIPIQELGRLSKMDPRKLSDCNARLKELLRRAPKNGVNTFIVGHYENLAAVGGPDLDEAGWAVFRPEGTDSKLIGTVSPQEWADLVQVTGPLRPSANANYFQDARGKALILCGSQTWNTLQDWGTHESVQPLDFKSFVRFLVAHGHNFTLLWRTELPRFCGLPTTDNSPPAFTVAPHPWMRTGPGTATDGGLKFDLTRFNPEYFNRLRDRVQLLGKAGVYAGVYLFTGEWLLRFRCPSDGYPFSGPNNVNAVDDGYRGGALATAVNSVTMTAPDAITAFQDAYVKKTVETLNDLPNVLWIVSEEAPPQSRWWNDHLIALIRESERTKPLQHPIGYAGLDSQPDSILYNSDADWVAPAAWLSPNASCGTGRPRCKVNINDSDHSYFGMWNDTPEKNRNYAWENFISGNQVLFMDPYLVEYPRQGRNLPAAPVNGIGRSPDARWDNFRKNLGSLVRMSQKLNLVRVTPNSSLSSTGFCLAQTPPAGAEYLIYAPSGGPFTVDLSAMPKARSLAVEWFNPAAGTTALERPIPAGLAAQSFTPPFSGDAVLYLVDTAGHR